mgnify:FL=1
MDKNEMTENKENVVIDDFDFSLIADFFKRVERQGPGGEWETRLATSLIPDFKRKIRIADMGCGKGSQTFVLADEYDAEIDAVDLLPEMMEGIRKKIQANGLEDQGKRIKMRSPPKVLTGNFRPSQLSSFLS